VRVHRSRFRPDKQAKLDNYKFISVLRGTKLEQIILIWTYSVLLSFGQYKFIIPLRFICSKEMVYIPSNTTK
jgi:hypothetical protein